MENNLEAGENNFSAVKLISLGSQTKIRTRLSIPSQIVTFQEWLEIDANFTLPGGESRVKSLG